MHAMSVYMTWAKVCMSQSMVCVGSTMQMTDEIRKCVCHHPMWLLSMDNIGKRLYLLQVTRQVTVQVTLDCEKGQYRTERLLIADKGREDRSHRTVLEHNKDGVVRHDIY